MLPTLKTPLKSKNKDIFIRYTVYYYINNVYKIHINFIYIHFFVYYMQLLVLFIRNYV